MEDKDIKKEFNKLFGTGLKDNQKMNNNKVNRPSDGKEKVPDILNDNKKIQSIKNEESILKFKKTKEYKKYTKTLLENKIKAKIKENRKNRYDDLIISEQKHDNKEQEITNTSPEVIKETNNFLQINNKKELNIKKVENKNEENNTTDNTTNNINDFDDFLDKDDSKDDSKDNVDIKYLEDFNDIEKKTSIDVLDDFDDNIKDFKNISQDVNKIRNLELIENNAIIANEEILEDNKNIINDFNINTNNENKYKKSDLIDDTDNISVKIEKNNNKLIEKKQIEKKTIKGNKKIITFLILLVGFIIGLSTMYFINNGISKTSDNVKVKEKIVEKEVYYEIKQEYVRLRDDVELTIIDNIGDNIQITFGKLIISLKEIDMNTLKGMNITLKSIDGFKVDFKTNLLELLKTDKIMVNEEKIKINE